MQRANGPGQGKPVLICILACSLAFGAITLEHRSYMKIAFYKNEASVAMNPLLSLFCCLVARSRRKRGKRQTDGQTHLQTKYNKPRCVCTPSVYITCL